MRSGVTEIKSKHIEEVKEIKSKHNAAMRDALFVNLIKINNESDNQQGQALQMQTTVINDEQYKTLRFADDWDQQDMLLLLLITGMKKHSSDSSVSSSSSLSKSTTTTTTTTRPLSLSNGNKKSQSKKRVGSNKKEVEQVKIAMEEITRKLKDLLVSCIVVSIQMLWTSWSSRLSVLLVTSLPSYLSAVTLFLGKYLEYSQKIHACNSFTSYLQVNHTSS